MYTFSSLYGRTLGLVGFVTLASVIALGLTMSAMNSLAEREDAHDIARALLEADIHARAFMISRDTLEATAARGHIERADNLVHQFGPADRSEISGEDSNDLDDLLHLYAAAFDSLEAAYHSRGLTEDQGAEGDFRQSIQAMEELVRGTRAALPMVHMLAARRDEKNFVIRGRSEYVERVLQNIQAIGPVARSEDVDEETVLEIEALGRAYLASFDRIVGLEGNISGYATELSRAREELVRTLDPVIRDADGFAFLARRLAILLLTLACVGGVVLAWWTARQIVRPLARIQMAAKQLVDGELPDQLELRGNREVWQLAQAINRVSLHEERRRTAEEDLRSSRDAAEKIAGELEVARLELETQAADLRRSVSDLKEARKNAEAASGSKTAFIANMSHEMRTPLNSIIGLSSLMEQSADASHADEVRLIRTSGEALLHIVNDVLEYSSLEAGQVELEPEAYSPVELVESVVDTFVPMAQAAGVRLQSIVDASVPQRLLGDVARLRQALTHLVGNAARFTSEGHIEVGVTYDRHHKEVTIEVSDTGAGIRQDSIDRLFEPFTQADETSTRSFGGAGLGLAICRKLVELMGGSVKASSIPEVGSVFKVVVPARSRSSLAAPDGPSLAGRRIALVGLDRTTYKAARSILTLGGGDLVRAEPGGVSHVHDVYLIPAERALEAPGIPRERLIMIAERASLVPAGIASLPLPIKRASLLRAIDTILGEKGRNGKRAEDRSPVSGRMRVLLAEDNRVNQKVLVLMLERLGYSADVVDDGQAAVEAFTLHPYDIVLMDLQMPRMDGLEACRQIRKLSDPAKQPAIVAVTAYASLESRDSCIEAGMDAFLAKPITPEDLGAGMKQAIALVRSRVALPLPL